MNATYPAVRRPTFRLLVLPEGVDIWSTDWRGHWVQLGIDGARYSPLLTDRLDPRAESTST